MKTKALSFTSRRARDSSMVSGFPLSYGVFPTLHNQKKQDIKYFLLTKKKKLKKHISEIVCVTHLTASAPCRGAAAQSLWKRARKAAVQHSTSPGCVQSVSKWRVPNP